MKSSSVIMMLDRLRMETDLGIDCILLLLLAIYYDSFLGRFREEPGDYLDEGNRARVAY